MGLGLGLALALALALGLALTCDVAQTRIRKKTRPSDFLRPSASGGPTYSISKLGWAWPGCMRTAEMARHGTATVSWLAV